MSKVTDFLDKQEGYNIECILENEDHKLALIALLKDFEKQLILHGVSKSFYCWEKEALNQKRESVCDVCRGNKLEAN